MTNGLFGDLDASEVSDDPFYVAPDTYLCVLTEAKIVDTPNSKHANEGLSLRWTIEDEDSDYYGNSINDWFNLYRDGEYEITANVKRTMANLKKRLLTLGLTDQQMNEIADNLDDLVGISAYVTTKESPDKNDPDKKWINVVKVEKVDE